MTFNPTKTVRFRSNFGSNNISYLRRQERNPLAKYAEESKLIVSGAACEKPLLPPVYDYYHNKDEIYADNAFEGPHIIQKAHLRDEYYMFTAHLKALPKSRGRLMEYLKKSAKKVHRRSFSVPPRLDTFRDNEKGVFKNGPFIITQFPCSSEAYYEQEFFQWRKKRRSDLQIQTVGWHHVQIGHIYGPGRFFVKLFNSDNMKFYEEESSFHDQFSEFYNNANEVQRRDIYYQDMGFLVYWDVDMRIYRRVYRILEESDGTDPLLFDMDTGEIVICNDPEQYLRALPRAFIDIPAAFQPAQLAVQVSPEDWNKFVNNINTNNYVYVTGFIDYIAVVGVTRIPRKAAKSTEFCEYPYCEGRCYYQKLRRQERRKEKELRKNLEEMLQSSNNRQDHQNPWEC